MKNLAFVILVLLLTSCGIISSTQGKIRYVRTDHNERVIIEKEAKKVEIAENQSLSNESTTSSQAISTDYPAKENLPKMDSEIKISDKANSIKLPDPEPEDDGEEDDQEIVDQALRAERQSKLALTFSAIGMLNILFPFVGVFFMVPGFIFYLISNSSRYITPEGEKNLNTAKKLLITDLVFLILWIVFILALLLLL